MISFHPYAMCSTKTINQCTNIIYKRVACMTPNLWHQSSKDKSLYIKPKMLCRFSIAVFIEGRYCHHLLCWQKSQKVWYLFHIHWIPMSICSGSITSIQMMCWETCSKISMAPGKQLFVGRAWSMALIQPCRKTSLNGRMIDCMLLWWLRSQFCLRGMHVKRWICERILCFRCLVGRKGTRIAFCLLWHLHLQCSL
jgi:hypothetical protein